MKKDNEKFCQECGEIINVKAEICPKCGVRQPYTSIKSEEQQKNENKSYQITPGFHADFHSGLFLWQRGCPKRRQWKDNTYAKTRAKAPDKRYKDFRCEAGITFPV